MQYATSLIPGARLEILDDTGHLPAMSQPDRIAKLILEHFEGPPHHRRAPKIKASQAALSGHARATPSCCALDRSLESFEMCDRVIVATLPEQPHGSYLAIGPPPGTAMTASAALQPPESFGGRRINGHQQPRPYHRARVTHMLGKLLVALLLMALCVAIHAVGFAAAVRRLRRNAIPQPSFSTRSVG